MLKGKAALVTGSTSGIGLAIARALAQQGAAVMLHGSRSAAEAEVLRATLARETGATLAYTAADAADPAAVRALVQATEKQLGRLDILVNNAGIQHVDPIDAFPEDAWDALLAINLSAMFHATKAALPGMKARDWGRIVNIASAHGLVASPFKAPYVATKHAMVGFSKAVALEVAETGITVNALCPGYVHTPLVDHQIKDQAKAHHMAEAQVVRDVILAAQPSKRFIGADEIGQFVVFLCSAAAQGITGAALPMDGGWTAR